jgi:hypothetical protein
MESRTSDGRKVLRRGLKLALLTAAAWGLPAWAQKAPDETVKALQVGHGP